MKTPVDLIMFDLDGTLADTGRDLADAVNYTRRCFKLSPLADRLIHDHVGQGVEHLLRHAVPEESLTRFQEVLAVFLERYEAHLLDRTVLYPGAREILTHFRGKRRAVVSNKIHRLTVAVLRGLGVEQEFDMVVGGDSEAKKKPHPAPLEAVLQRFSVPAAGAVMVGDGSTDVEAGKRAGVITCAVTFGLGRKDELAAAKPDLWIDKLSELADHFC